eukprot:4425464-Ditylum_brightwellii.AAC.1
MAWHGNGSMQSQTSLVINQVKAWRNYRNKFKQDSRALVLSGLHTSEKDAWGKRLLIFCEAVYNKKLVSDQTIDAVKICLQNSKLVANGAIGALSSLMIFNDTLITKGTKELQDLVWSASDDDSISK